MNMNLMIEEVLVMRKKEELDLYIETCVMNRVNYKRKINQKTNEEYYEGTYKLSFFERDNLEDEEIKYVFNRLNDKNIIVVGNSPVLYGDFENYKYVKKPMFCDQKEQFDEEKFNQLMYQFKMMNKDTEEEKEKVNTLRKQIIAINVRLVNFLVSRYNSDNEFENDELLSYGYEGLISAVDNYDIDKGQFSSFALKCIEGYLIRGMQFLRGFSSTSFYYKYKNAKNSLEKELGMSIENDLEYLDELASKIYSTYVLPIDTIEELKTRIALMKTLSIEKMKDELYDDNTLYNEVIEALNLEYLKEDLEKCLSKLTSREKEIMIEKYGLKDGQIKTCREVAGKVGCKYQNIHEIEKRSLNKLRNFSENTKLDEYYTNIGEYDYNPTGIEFSKVKQKVK